MSQYTYDDDLELLNRVKPTEIMRLLKLYPTMSQSQMASYIRADDAAAVEAVHRRFNMKMTDATIAALSEMRDYKSKIWKE